VTLANGQLCRQLPGDTDFAHWTKPAASYAVRITRGALGSFNLKVKDRPKPSRSSKPTEWPRQELPREPAKNLPPGAILPSTMGRKIAAPDRGEVVVAGAGVVQKT
jgi:hypothetical protein